MLSHVLLYPQRRFINLLWGNWFTSWRIEWNFTGLSRSVSVSTKNLVRKKKKECNITKIGEIAALSGVGERSIKNVNLPYSSFSQDHLQSFNPPPQEISFEHLMDAVSLYIKNLPKKKAELEKYKEKLLLAIDKQFSIPSAVSPVNRNFFCIHLWFTNFLLALVVDMYVCL